MATNPLTLFHFGPFQERNIRRDEIVYLDTFRHVLVEEIAGHTGRPALKRLILQGIHDEAALCHVALAYGALNHSLDNSQHHVTARGTTMELVFRHYTQGISDMQRVLDRKDNNCRNVILLCALLCICCEIRCRRPHKTHSHLRHALEIVSASPLQGMITAFFPRSIQISANTPLLAVDEDIFLAFTRLDILAAVSIRRHIPVTDIGRFSSIGNNGIDFHWIGEHEFTALLGHLCFFIRSEVDDVRFGNPSKTIPLHIQATAQRFQEKLYHFRHVYLGHVLPDARASSRMTPKRGLLWLKYLAAIILLRPCFSMEERAFDGLLPEFSSIVALVESGAHLRDQPSHQRHQLNLDMGVIHPLFKVATKCRSPHVRRKAIALLGTVAGLEAGWDAPAFKVYAERTMKLEEEGLGLNLTECASLEPSIISESRRIHVLEIWPAGERCSTVTFRKRPNGVGTDWIDITENITW